MKLVDKLFPMDVWKEERQFVLYRDYLWHRNRRREQLVRKWEKTTHFKKQSISGKWECEFMSLVPEDCKWHNVTATVSAWVKKDPNTVRKDSELNQYIDGSKIASVSLTKGNNITIGRKAKK